jgi:four helix bundle protein
MAAALVNGMFGVDRVEDLDIYKLAVELRREVIRLTSTGAVARDHKFVTQIRDSARGAARTMSEGFSRLAPLEFHKFLRTSNLKKGERST